MHELYRFQPCRDCFSTTVWRPAIVCMLQGTIAVLRGRQACFRLGSLKKEKKRSRLWSARQFLSERPSSEGRLPSGAGRACGQPLGGLTSCVIYSTVCSCLCMCACTLQHQRGVSSSSLPSKAARARRRTRIVWYPTNTKPTNVGSHFQIRLARGRFGECSPSAACSAERAIGSPSARTSRAAAGAAAPCERRCAHTSGSPRRSSAAALSQAWRFVSRHTGPGT